MSSNKKALIGILMVASVVAFFVINEGKVSDAIDRLFASKSRFEDTPLESAIKEAELYERTDKRVFLGLEFGMTKKQCFDHLDKLADDGAVFVDDSRKYYCHFNTEQGQAKAYISVYLHEDDLYEVKFNIHTNRDGLLSTSRLLYHAAYKVFEKANPDYRRYIEKDRYLDEDNTAYIKNNIVVSFKENFGSVDMVYTDAPANRKRRDDASREQKEKEDQTISLMK